MTGKNNGNVYSQMLDAPGLPATLTQAYSYDGVNRLGGVTETGGGTNWSRTYAYDAYGNRAANGAAVFVDTPQSVSGDFDAANNRLKAAWAGYDSAGNLITFKPDSFEWTASYDADNKQAAFCPGTESACSGVAAGSKTVYDYDGDGNRVRKIVNDNEASLYVYDAFGNLAAEYADFAPAGPTGTQYRTTDHLGSTRVVSDAGGAILSRRDFFPFGEEIMASGTFGNRNQVTDGQGTTAYNDPSGYRQQFTGKERDAETGLDYFESRYFSSAQGRFTSPDVMMGKPEWLVDPQRWNRYAYVRNNPLKYIDPNGEDLVIYYSLGSDVSDADREWFNENKSAILGAIQAKYEEAGVKNVSLRDQSTLSKDQLAALDNGTPFGVSRLTFVGKEYPGLGQAPMMGVLGYAHPDGKGIAGVFLDTLPKVHPAGCDQACMAANVGAHELGHTLGMPHLGFFEEMADRFRQRPAMLGGTETRPDLMTGSMGTPTQPLYFKPGTNERTQRAIQQLNRIGDMTPKK